MEVEDIEEVDDGWLLRYDQRTGDAIASVCPDELLAAHGCGPLRWRTTRVEPDGYLPNTCLHCGGVWGNWPLYEALLEYEAEGGDLRELPCIPADIPEGALRWLQDAPPIRAGLAGRRTRCTRRQTPR